MVSGGRDGTACQQCATTDGAAMTQARRRKKPMDLASVCVKHQMRSYVQALAPSKTKCVCVCTNDKASRDHLPPTLHATTTNQARP